MEFISEIKERYYYIRDKNNRPVVTVCLLEREGVTARGVAICSPRDNVCKSRGRNLAHGRAVRALVKAGSGELDVIKNRLDPIKRKEARTVIRDLIFGLDLFPLPPFLHKTYFMPCLTTFEKKLVAVPA